MWTRLINAVFTFPHPDDCRLLAGFLIVILGSMLLLGFRSDFLKIEILKAPWKTIARILLITFFFPTVAEEILFRVLLLPHPAEKLSIAAQWLWGSISLVLFIVYHPLNALTFYPAALTVFKTPIFLVLVALFGIACIISYLQSGSLWLPVVIHWLCVVVWLLLLGGYSKLHALPNSGA